MNSLKKKNLMVISMEAEKVFDNIQHPLVIKTPSKLGIENFLNLIKIYKNNLQLTSNLLVREWMLPPPY